MVKRGEVRLCEMRRCEVRQGVWQAAGHIVDAAPEPAAERRNAPED